MIILSGSGTVASNPSIFDAASTGSAENTNVSWSHTAAGSDRVLLVYIYYWNGGNTGSRISGVTFNGVALTFLDTQRDAGAQQRTMDVWYLLNPDTGTHTIAVSGMGFGSKCGVGISLSDAAQSAPTAFKANGNSTTASVTLTGTVNDLFIDAAGESNNGTDSTMTAGGSQTDRAQVTETGNQRMASSTAQGSASLAMIWTLQLTRNWSHIGVKVAHV